MRSDISVAMVIPVINERSVLEGLLALLPGLGCDEVLIVDGGSTDGSLELLQKNHASFIQAGQGRAKQMNRGAASTTSAVLVFVHADSGITSEHIAAIRAAMQESCVVGGRFDVLLSGTSGAFRVIEWFINWRSRLSGISTGDQAMFVRREVFDAMGGFAGIPLMEDVEFSRRLKRQGRVACLRQKVLTSSRRWEQHGIVRTVLLMWRLRLLFWLGVSPVNLAAMYREAR